MSLRGTVFCAEAIPIVVGSNRCEALSPVLTKYRAISESAIGDCFAKTARNDTGLNGYVK